jgi:hypothetical protein
VVASYAFYGANSVFLDEEFAYFDDFFFREMFSVDRGQFSFGKEVVAVEAFVELVTGSVFSISDEVFSFFF